MASGKERRLRRLLGEDDKTLLVAVDHSLTTGFAGGLGNMGQLLRQVVTGGADGVVLHRGSARRDMPVQRATAMIVHLSGSTGLSDQRDLKIRVCDPEDAASLGADAVSVHVTLGCGHREDREALADLGAVAGSCDRLGLPLLAMTYVRAGDQPAPTAVLHAARAVAELGADVVKVSSPDLDTTFELASRIPIPVVVAGGEAADGGWESFLESARLSMETGIAGLCVGRWVFGHRDPALATAQLRAIVHENAELPPTDVLTTTNLQGVEFSL